MDATKYRYDQRLTTAQLTRASEQIAVLVEAIAKAPRNYVVEDVIGIFNARSIWGLLFPPKHRPRNLDTTWGIPFGGKKGESDFHGMLAWMPDGTLHIATPLGYSKRTGKFRSPYYRTHTVFSYVEYYLAAAELPGDIALSNIDKAAYHLERLLDDGHPLKRPERADITTK